MIRNLIGAAIGRKLAGRGNGARGAMFGMAAPWLARRAFSKTGLAVAGAWGAKRLWDRRRARRGATPQI